MGGIISTKCQRCDLFSPIMILINKLGSIDRGASAEYSVSYSRFECCEVGYMDSLIVPDLALLRRWLDQSGISFFECNSCQALHLPHMQNFDGVFDAKVDLVDNVILFSALAEVKPTTLIPLVANLSLINASSLTIKAFVDIQDDNLPKLIVCQSLSIAVGVTLEQFTQFMQQGEEQISMVILEARENDLLYISDEEESPSGVECQPVLH